MKTKIFLLMCSFWLCLKVFAVHPWEVNPHDYRYDMTVFLKVQIDNKDLSAYEGCAVAAFCGDECRGINDFFIQQGYAFVPLRIYSNKPSQETISFYFYDVADNRIKSVEKTIEFQTDVIVGMPSSPLVLNHKSSGCHIATFDYGDCLIQYELTEGEKFPYIKNPVGFGIVFKGWYPAFTQHQPMPDKDVIYKAEIADNGVFQYYMLCVTEVVSGSSLLISEFDLVDNRKQLIPNVVCYEGTQGNGTSENWDKLTDGKTNTYYLKHNLHTTCYLFFDANRAVTIGGYGITTGNYTKSYPGRNPKSWKLYGSTVKSSDANSENWTLIHEVLNDKILQPENATRFVYEAIPFDRVHVTEITLDKIEATMSVGDNLLLDAHVQPDNATITTIDWSSADSSIASVSSKGVVTGVSGGTTIITATATDGSGICASCKVTVIKDKYLLKYVVDGEVYNETMVKIGAPITPITYPSKAGYTFSGWSEIPTVMPEHDVTISGFFIPDTPRISHDMITLSGGESIRLTVYLGDSDVEINNVLWSSSREDVATVNVEGVIRGYNKGKTVITASSPTGTIYGTCTISVTSDFVVKGYRYYQLCINDITSGGTMQISEFALLDEGNQEISGVTIYSGTPSGISKEDYFNLTDGSTSTKYCTTQWTSKKPLRFYFDAQQGIVPSAYRIYTANDNKTYPSRNPKSWQLFGSNTYSEDPADDCWELLDEIIDDKTIQAVNYTPFDFALELQIPDSTIVLGDVDGDGNVTISDLASIVSFITGAKVIPTFNTQAADVNHDSKIDKDDVNTIANMILNTN